MDWGNQTDFEIRFKVVPCLIERYRDRISALGGSQPPVKPLPRLSAGAVHPACLTELFPEGYGRAWTKKHGKSHYTSHVNVDRRHKLVRRYQVTDAAVHDSQVVDDILDPDNTASEVWAAPIGRRRSRRSGLKSRIHRKGYRNKPLSEREKRGNTTRSKVRARVEHVFGAQSNDMGGTLVRSIDGTGEGADRGGYPSRVSPVTLGVLANDRVLLLIREWGLGNATFTYLATVAGWPSGARDSAGKGQLAMTSVREFGFGCFGGVKGGRVTGPTTYTYLLNFTPAGLLDHSDYKMSHAPYENYAIYTRGCLGFVSITHDTVTEQDRVVGYAIDGLPDLGYEEDVFHQQPCFNRTMQRFADTFPTELSPETLNAFAERFIFDCAGS